ncbi:hypothetical protein ACQPT2_17450 [Erwinia amylovora]
MKKISMALMALSLCGCIDLGRVGMHPELKTVYFNGHQHAVQDCLYSAALQQGFSLLSDDKMLAGIDRYNLEDKNHEVAAWVDISPFGKEQTNADFFYASDAPDVKSAVFAIIAQCENSLY